MVDPRGHFLVDEFDEAKYQEAQALAAANPKPSALLEMLENDETVVVDRHDLSRQFVSLQRFPGAPAWTRDRSVRLVRVSPEDVLIPGDD
jgi:hypothetical protein